MGWVHKSYAQEKSPFELFLPVVTALAMRGIDWQFAFGVGVCAILMLFLLPKTNEKKKFVVTARVKRLYAAAFLIFAAALALTNVVYYLTSEFSYMPTFLCAFALTAAYTLRYTVVLAANVLMAPVEKAVANHYIKDAKRILDASPSLETIGITGSFGKTSTKYILQRILSEKWNTLMTPDSFNTPMGVVRTVRERLSATDRFFICEMGAKQKGDIKEICDIVKPKHCIITSVGNCHLESFKTVQNVCDTKFELYDCVGGISVLNFDSLPVREREKAHGCISYGTTADCDYYVKDITCGPRGMSFTLHTRAGEEFSLSTRLLGQVNALNIAGACAMAIELGQDIKSITFAVSHLSPVPHRLELKGAGSELVIDDAFNSNPEGARQAVQVLQSFEGVKRILVTPGIVELGADEERCNIQLGRDAAPCADCVIGVSHLAKYIEVGLSEAGFDMKNYYHAENFRMAQSILSEIKHGPSVVLYENDLPDNLENT